VHIPKPEGVKKGWDRMWLVVSNGKLSFHTLKKNAGKPGTSGDDQPEAFSFLVVDLRFVPPLNCGSSFCAVLRISLQ
jgi:hypothetical protein